jgi:hypothetical protein
VLACGQLTTESGQENKEKPVEVRRRIGAALTLVGLLVMMLPSVAFADQPDGVGQSNTCKDQDGFDTNLESGTSGDWGNVTFTPNSGTLDLTVAAGYEVQLCIKKGNVDPPITEWLTEGQHSFDVPYFPQFPGDAGDGFSHYALRYRTVDPSTTTTVPEETTTTVPEETTTTVPEETTTTTVAVTSTVPETTTTVPVTPTTTTPENPEQPEELPFTGPSDWLKLPALFLLAMGAFLVASTYMPGWGLEEDE